tara:strand:- start:628 stop:1800 length:1173 start_codon:yes stop_codon:yes gene_type:complete
MDRGTIVSWIVAQGESFERGDTLLELETDKALVEYPALGSGRLIETLLAEGDEVNVGDPIAIIETDKVWPTIGDQDEGDDTSEPTSPLGIAKPEGTTITPLASAETTSATDDVRSTPLARRLALLGDVDIQELEGTGRRGRIEASDIVAAIKSGRTRRSKFLLLHGLGSNAMSWGALITSLEAGGDQVTAIDLPGHGANPEDAASINDLVDYVVAHMRNLSGKVHVVGHSLGAWVAAKAASKVPDAVSEMMLIAPAGCGPDINVDFVRGLAEVKEMDQLRDLLSMLGPTAQATPDGAATGMLQDLSRGRLHGIAAELLNGGTPHLDIIPILDNIKNSFAVSAVIGIQDQIFPKESLFKLPSHVNIHIVNAGHVPHWDVPIEIAALLQKPV